jgi:uncharacterized protein
MQRLLCLSCLLSFLVLACDKPVPSEIVAPRRSASSGGGGGFADGAVVQDDLDAGLATSDDAEAEEPDEGEEDVPFSKGALIKAAADCALDHLESLRAAAELLRDASARWAQDRGATNAADARSAFRTAVSRFERAEPLKFGPLARSSSLGGQNLGDKIYTPFSAIDRCAIDRQIALGMYGPKDIASAPARQRGLGAFEYLAYYVGSDNGCQAAIDINTNGSWAALSAEELAQRRADFAAAIAADVLSLVDQGLEAWSEKGGDFYGQITEPGGKLFRDQQSALNTISNAMFYVELDVKDVKLGRILNRAGTTCQALTCPDALEAPLSGLSAQNLRDNLAGFRDVFQGCGTGNRGLGFDDWLDAVGASLTKTSMLDALAGAEAAVNAIPSLERALSENPASVMAAYDAVKKLTDRLKGELPSALGVEPPAGLEGDND